MLPLPRRERPGDAKPAWRNTRTIMLIIAAWWVLSLVVILANGMFAMFDLPQRVLAIALASLITTAFCSAVTFGLLMGPPQLPARGDE